MGFIGTVIAIIVAILAAQGIKEVTAKTENDNIVVRSGDNVLATVPITELEPVQQKPLDYAESFGKKIASADTAKPSKANLTVTPQLDAEVILYNLSIAANSAKKTGLAVEVFANGTSLASLETGTLDFVDVYNVPLGDKGLRIDRGTSVEFFVWGGGDVEILANGLFGANFDEVKS